MKNLGLSVALALAILVASESLAGAQGVYVEYKKQNKNSSLTITYSGGYSTGYGYGYGYGAYGYGGTYYSPGYASYYRPPYASPYYHPYYHGSRPVANYAPVYSSSPVSAERVLKIRMQKDVEEGLRRFRSADYRRAVDAFRAAFLADTDSAVLQLFLGLSLAGAGDLRNAEKAFRGAFEHLKPEEALGADLPKLFRDTKEEERFVSSVASSPLVSGVVAYLMGRKDAAKGALNAVKDDPAARKLLEVLAK
jgi:hypothetical protein